MTTHRTRFVLFALATIVPFLAACSNATGGEVGSEGLTDGYRHYGDPAIVALFVEKTNGQVGTCTGTVIGAFTVLTAAHCLGPDSTKVNVYFGDDPQAYVDRGHDATYIDLISTQSFFRHPWYDGKNYDAGIVWLPRQAPVEPAYVLANAVDGLEGYTTMMIAYGSQGVDAEGNPVGQTHKQIGYAPISAIDPMFIKTDGRGGWTNQCRGDSGSPLLLGYDGAEYLLGISSFGDTPCNTHSYFQRLDVVLPWVQANLY